jgi:hypothetical protein
MLKTLIFLMGILTHPVHVSLMSLEYSPENRAFKVFLKVYCDDFVLDYRLLTGDSSNIDLSVINDNVKKIADKYLIDKVQIFAGDRKLEMRSMNIESSEGELKFNLLYDSKRKSNEYTVKNLIMTDLYKDQSNLIIFTYDDFQESIKLTAEKREQVFKINR